jgi:hypothetical protein
MIAGIWKAEERGRAITRAREIGSGLTERGYPCSEMRSIEIEVLLFNRLVSMFCTANLCSP